MYRQEKQTWTVMLWRSSAILIYCQLEQKLWYVSRKWILKRAALVLVYLLKVGELLKWQEINRLAKFKKIKIKMHVYKGNGTLYFWSPSHSCPQIFQSVSISIHHVSALLFSPHYSRLCFGIAALFLPSFLFLNDISLHSLISHPDLILPSSSPSSTGLCGLDCFFLSPFLSLIT